METVKPLLYPAADYDVIAIGTPTWWYIMQQTDIWNMDLSMEELLFQMGVAPMNV